MQLVVTQNGQYALEKKESKQERNWPVKRSHRLNSYTSYAAHNRCSLGNPNLVSTTSLETFFVFKEFVRRICSQEGTMVADGG